MATSITNTSISTDTINVDNGVLYVDNTNNRVGVGTASPTASLHVAGINTLFDSDTYGILELRVDNNDDQTNNDGIIKITTGSASLTKAELRYDESEDLVHLSYGDHSRNISISSTGNVGIGTGTIDPNGKLDVTSSRSTGYSTTGDQRSLAHIVARNGSDAPGRFASISLVSGGGTQAEGSINLVQTGNYVGDLAFKLRAGGGSSDWRERMRIDSAGRVTMPYQPGFQARGNTSQWLTVSSTGAAGWVTMVGGVSNGDVSAGTIGVNLTTVDNNGVGYVTGGSNFNTSNGRFTAPVAGRYLITGTNYCSKSSGAGSADYIHTLIYINGAQANEIYTIGGNQSAAAGDFYLTFSHVFYLNAGDYVEWKLFSNASTYMKVYGDHCSIGATLLG